MIPPSLKQQTKDLARLSKRVLLLQSRIDRDRTAALDALPSQFGYPDMPAFIKALRSACEPAKRIRRRKASRRSSPPLPSIAPASPAETPPQTISIAHTTPAPPPPPAGDSLDDPKNFTLLPDLSLLDPTGKDPAAFRATLTDRLRYAEKVLATSGVPARIWREWRQFERQSRALLQG